MTRRDGDSGSGGARSGGDRTGAPPSGEDPAPAGRELELKLELDSSDLRRLRSHPLLAEPGAGRRKARRLRTIYYDTPDLRLRDAGLSVRVRRTGRSHVQTVKAGNAAAAGLFDRQEWERPVAGAALDLSAAAGTALEPLLAKRGVRERLAPVFVVETERRTIDLSGPGWAAEMTIDDGAVAVGAQRDALCEVELELRQGSARDLFALARNLSESVPLRLGIRTKAERGYALATGEGSLVTKGGDAGLVAGMSAAQAFQAIGRACLRHLVANQPILRAARSPEAVHQIRVALRRLRAAIAIFKPVIGDEQRVTVSTELKWLADQLGDARDIDVFIAGALSPLAVRHGADPEFVALVEHFERHRDEAYAKALAAIDSQRCRLTLIDTAAWIEAGPWLEGESAARAEPIGTLAARILARRSRKIAREGRHLEKMSPAERHDLRIAVKKLRYAAEFFGPVLAPKGQGKKRARRRKSFIAAAIDLQERLGHLNDAAVGEGLGLKVQEGLDETGRERAARFLRPEPEQGADAVAGAEPHQNSAALLKSARKAFKAFARADPFWE